MHYYLRLPPALTKARQTLVMLCNGRVLRCENLDEEDFSFGIALQSRGCRYLAKDESA